jgi:hypothetical protein
MQPNVYNAYCPFSEHDTSNGICTAHDGDKVSDESLTPPVISSDIVKIFTDVFIHGLPHIISR